MSPSLLSDAVHLLHSGGFTCVLCSRSRVLTSAKRGIAPLLEWIEAGEDLRGVCCADKIIGRAAALLLVRCGASAAHGDVMSAAAKELLEANGVAVSYDALTEQIINRRGDGPCPMEQAVAGLTDPAAAPQVLREALNKLSQQ